MSKDKKKLIYTVIIILVLLAAFLAYWFVVPKDDGGDIVNQAAAIEKMPIRALDKGIFKEEKYKELKDNKIDWHTLDDLEIGSVNPFAPSQKAEPKIPDLDVSSPDFQEF